MRFPQIFHAVNGGNLRDALSSLRRSSSELSAEVTILLTRGRSADQLVSSERHTHSATRATSEPSLGAQLAHSQEREEERSPMPVIPPLVLPPPLLERRDAAAHFHASGEDEDMSEARPPLLRRDVAEQSYPAPPRLLRRSLAVRDLTSQLRDSGEEGSDLQGEDTLQEGNAILQRWESRMGAHRSRDAFYGEPPRQDNRERRNAVDLTSERHRSSLGGLRQMTARAVPSLLSMLPSRQLTPRFVQELSTRVESCAICCDVYQADEDVACLPCHGFHMAHTHCLRRWLEQKPECPMCRWTTDDTSPAMLRSRVATAWTHLRRTD